MKPLPKYIQNNLKWMKFKIICKKLYNLRIRIRHLYKEEALYKMIIIKPPKNKN